MELKALMCWYNLVYVVPFCLGVVLLILQTIGLGETGLDHDVDHDVDHDMDHDIDHDADHDAEHGHDVESDQDNLLWKVALLMGFGKVPLSILIMTFFFVWGAVGYMLTSALQPILRTPFLFFPPVFLATLIITIFVTGYVARIVARVMPKTSTFTTTTKDLIGKVGESLYSIDKDHGTIRVIDQFGNLQQYPAYTSEDSIPGNTQVLIVNWDEQRDAFLVTILPPELAELKKEEERLKGG
ncbi:MAG: hypothetical protein A2Y67_02695 [Candidatus Buchananbacteria bacterium RBG_13_39_9]|uniref:Inner membrane protein YqiJ N-terminal domain-containing protein n=1 Tax=Candidatus Buchananbacteria bacterium RBG_13_39_9 TaxID=1797531 RepID=A0A1G1XMU0_9BACT|nr:MAG: hypothetical protein A2Y67_02695 [Candidatus Buchananbacteria bacterium RBG_13_39_9]